MTDELGQLALTYIRDYGLGHHFVSRTLGVHDYTRRECELFADAGFEPKYNPLHEDLRQYIRYATERPDEEDRA